MTRAYVERCVRVWQERLGLQAWDVSVTWDVPPSEDSNATTRYRHDYDRADISFEEAFGSWSREFLNRIVVHELLHLHLRDVDRVVDDLDGLLHRDVFSQVDKRYWHESEGLVDRLSYRLVEIGGCV